MSGVRFQAFGPLTAECDGESLNLGPPKQRAVLAILLLHANSDISTERIIDLVWGPEPPRTAAHSVQIYISDLRKALSRIDPDLIETRALGYRLNTPTESIDLFRFQHLVKAGQEHVRAGDLDSGKTALELAIAEWETPPLSEFTYEEFAVGHIRRLEALRLDALEALAVIHIDQARNSEAISAARQAAEIDPLREEPRRLLMLALYRSQRQADALREFRDYRDLLVDQLGIEPTPLLQRLEERILNQDESLSTGPDSAASTLLIVTLTDAPPDLVCWFDGRGDGSFGDLIGHGIDMAREAHGLIAGEIVGHGPQVDQIRNLIDVGVGLVLLRSAHVFESAYQDELVDLFVNRPDAHFVLIDCPFRPVTAARLGPFPSWPSNLGCISVANEEMGFVAGVTAALATSTGRVGFVGGVDIEVIRTIHAGFESGAAFMDPAVQVEQVYLSDDLSGFTSPALGMAGARFLNRRGVDVILHASGGSGLGVFRWAARQRLEDGSGPQTIGIDVDQRRELELNQQSFALSDEELESAQASILLSVRKRLDLGIAKAVQNHIEDKDSTVIVLDTANAGVDYTRNGPGPFPFAEELDRAIKRLAASEIVIDPNPGQPARMLLDQIS